MVWNVNENDGTNETAGNGDEDPVINVAGDTVEFEVGDNFVESVIEVARDFGLGKFKVVLNGHEIDNEDAPEEFEAGDVVTLVKFEDPA